MPASRPRAAAPVPLTTATAAPRALLALALALLGARLAPPAADAAQPLTLQPPALSDPTTVYPTNTYRDLRLDPAKDYVVKMPPYPLEASYGLQITGGRNVVLIGGHIRIPWQGTSPAGTSRRGLYLKDQRGTIHVEGLLIDGPDVSEGINLDERLGAKVQLANIRVIGLHARDNVRFTDTHPDVIQTWGGPTELHVDGLTGTTNYQGFFLDPTKYGSARPRLFSFRRVDLSATTTAGYLLMQMTPVPTRIDDVWVNPSPLKTDWQAMWPNPLGAWSGVRIGRPPAGDFVPAGTAGLGYQSPGYTTTPVRSGLATSPTEDKARNRPTLASGTYPTTRIARYAVDGDPATRWSSPYAINHWWQVDLGAVRKVDQVRVNWENAYASRYRISGSNDGTTWRVITEARASRPGVAATTFPATSTRFVRITTLERATRWGASFWDVNVLGPAD